MPLVMTFVFLSIKILMIVHIPLSYMDLPRSLLHELTTIFCAPSAIESAATMFRPDSFSIFLPSSTFVPSSRTTSGRSSRARLRRCDHAFGNDVAAHDAAENVDEDPFHLRSDRMILNASVTFSFVAPPPTSRKLAGSPP